METLGHVIAFKKLLKKSMRGRWEYIRIEIANRDGGILAPFVGALAKEVLLVVVADAFWMN